MRLWIAMMTVVLSLVMGASVLAFEDEKPSSPNALKPIFSDDFTTDSRVKYAIKGNVGWKAGRLELAKGSSVGRAFKAGSRVRVELGLEFDELTKDGDLSVTFLQIDLLRKSPCYVGWIRSREKGKTSSRLRIYSTVVKGGKLQLKPVRTQSLAGDMFSGRWSVEYHHGLIQVSAQDRAIVGSYIENGSATVKGVRLLLQTGSAGLFSSLSVSGSAPPRETTVDEQKQLTEATKFNSDVVRFYRQGQTTKAIGLSRRALELRRRVLGVQHPRYATNLNNLATLYLSMGEYTKAEPLYLEARDIWKKVLGDQHPDYARSLNNLAMLYKAMGEYAKAEPLYLQSRDIRKKVLGEQHPDYANSLNNLAGLYDAMGEYAKAEPLNREAWQSLHVHVATNLPTLSEAQARAFLDKHRPRTDYVLSNARKLKITDPRTIYDYVWSSRALATRHVRFVATDFLADSKAFAVQCDLLQARRRLAQLVVATHPKGQVKQFQSRIAAANVRKEQLEKQLASLSDETAAFLRVRDARVGQLIKTLPKRARLVDILKTVDRKTETTERNGKTIPKHVSTQHYEAFVVTPTGKGGDYKVAWIHLGPAEPIDKLVSQWRKSIIEGTGEAPSAFKQAVWDKIAPHLGDSRQVVLIPDGKLSQVPWAALPGKKPGSYLIEDYAISTVGFGQQLYGLLASKPVTGKGLVLAGGIDYSRSPEKGSSSPTKIETPLIAGRRRAAATKGDKNVVWQALPGTAKEAQQIEQLYRQDASRKIVFLTGRNAAEEDVARAMTGGRYVHLATHGFFAAPGIKSIFEFDPRQQTLFGGATSRRSSASVGGRNPLLLSGVVLSGANLGARKDKYGFPTGEDGILTAEEVANLKLRNTDLVVLSACETGLGDVAAGEGVFGLQRAFHIAGARTVIASMWNVDDVATQTLMVAFYHNLWEKKLGKLEALRQAQLSMIHGFDAKAGVVRGPKLNGKTFEFSTSKAKTDKSRSLPPFYWAAFTLSGDWR